MHCRQVVSAVYMPREAEKVRGNTEQEALDWRRQEPHTFLMPLTFREQAGS
jgi:hypothetical protein